MFISGVGLEWEGGWFDFGWEVVVLPGRFWEEGGREGRECLGGAFLGGVKGWLSLSVWVAA
jgi:hypothetical protein